jgi:hypothetical protein
VKNPLTDLPPAARRWLLRIAFVAALLSLIGLLSSPTVSPLMCKIYG